jgi:hypothetical protein
VLDINTDGRKTKKINASWEVWLAKTAFERSDYVYYQFD